MIAGRTHVSFTAVTFDLLDAGGVVHHPNYLVLCERARHEVLAAAGCSFQALWKEGLALVVRSTSTEHLRPLLMGDEVAVLTALLEATPASLTVGHHLVHRAALLEPLAAGALVEGEVRWRPEGLVYEARIKLAAFNMKELRPTRIPRALRAALHLPVKAPSQEHF